MNELNAFLHCDFKNQNYYNVTERIQCNNRFTILLTPRAIQKYQNYYNVTESVQGSNNVTDSVYRGPFQSNLAGLGVITFTGILLPIIIDVLINNQLVKRGAAVINSLHKICSGKTFSRTFALMTLVLVLPFVAVFLLLMSMYKIICYLIIKETDRYFAGFLNGFDVFWNLEDDATKSIINVLGVIETDCPFKLSNNIKEKLRRLISNENVEKIFYSRYERYGFHYWRKYPFINVDKYVEVVKTPGHEKLDITDLEMLMTDIQEKSLPYDDRGLFQILITQKRVSKYEEDTGEYGIIFRIHHSVGDGVALIEFLCQSFADSTRESPQMFTIPETYNNINRSLSTIAKFCKILICFVDSILRKPDQNELHGKHLTGKKIFKWTKSDEYLLEKVKDIKNNMDNLNFTDVLLKALSCGLHNLFKQRMYRIPDDIATILPMRFPIQNRSTEKSEMFTSNFTVTTLDVPVHSSDMDEIKIRCNEMRRSGDPLMNYYFLNLTTSTLPCWILHPLLQSLHATLVFSNMPGPDHISICGGNNLKSLVFFVPNKGTTGLGITALSYDGVLRLAAMADVAVATSEDLGMILDGMVEEVNRMHQLYV